jgi:hypothetical protein
MNKCLSSEAGYDLGTFFSLEAFIEDQCLPEANVQRTIALSAIN